MSSVLGRAVAVGLAAALAAGSTARADSFDAQPVTIETRDGLGQIVLTNPGDRRIYLETEIYDWTQDAAGHDLTAESEEAIASPPAMWVPPHSTYNLRVKLPLGPSGQERAFRIFIRQLPDRSDIVGGRIVFALTQSLPAFAEPAELTPPSLTARLIDDHHLMVSNDGVRRARLSDVRQDGQVVAPGLAGYALGHSAAAVVTRKPIRPGTIQLQTDLGPRTLVVR